MIVFRPREEHADPHALIARLRERVFRSFPIEHDDVADWLIDAGVLESALFDAMKPGCDGDCPELLAAAQTTMLAGEALVASWKNEAVGPIARKLDRSLIALSKHGLPQPIVTRVPEGFAFHGVYPETYIAAAEEFARDRRPAHVVVVGLRSIGTSLSAVVAAALSRNNCRVLRRVLRPKGEPEERWLALDRDLAEIFATRRRAWFVIVDEGPGMTGSSIATTARTLERLGVPKDHIVLFPSWKPDPQFFRIPPVREVWSLHPAYTGSFEEQWLASGRLPRSLGLDSVQFVESARRTPLLHRDGTPLDAATLPQRRKLVGVREGAAALARFIGLGGCGRVKRERAERLAEARLTPEVLACANGFLATRLLPGASPAASLHPDLLQAIAKYLAFVRLELTVEGGTPFAEISEMAQANVAEGLGESWAAKIGHALSRVESSMTPVRTEGRMVPEDWRYTPEGWRKTDASDEPQEHDFPGCTDIAWDVAAVSEEFALPAAADSELVARIRRLTGDKSLGQRVAPFRVAYLAYRLGFATVCASTVPASEAPFWEGVAASHRERLREAIAAVAGQ